MAEVLTSTRNLPPSFLGASLPKIKRKEEEASESILKISTTGKRVYSLYATSYVTVGLLFTLTDSVFSKNVATTTSDRAGGGVSFHSGQYIVERTQFLENVATNTDAGMLSLQATLITQVVFIRYTLMVSGKIPFSSAIKLQRVSEVLSELTELAEGTRTSN